MCATEREIIVWLKDGKYRIKILKLLNIESLLPSEIAQNLQTHRSTISRTLKQLKKEGLVDRVSSVSRTKEYYITEKGKKILSIINSKHQKQ